MLDTHPESSLQQAASLKDYTEIIVVVLVLSPGVFDREGIPLFEMADFCLGKKKPTLTFWTLPDPDRIVDLTIWWGLVLDIFG